MQEVRVAEFIALYRGRTVADAELVAICAEKRIVAKFFQELVGERGEEDDGDPRGRVVELARGESEE
jgi:hypothetical protein